MSPEDLAEIREGYWGRIGSNQESKIRLLFDHIDTQAAQIAALKEKLVSGRMRTFEDWDENCIDTDIECPDTRNPSECHGCEIYERARQQLAEELPEVDWE